MIDLYINSQDKKHYRACIIGNIWCYGEILVGWDGDMEAKWLKLFCPESGKKRAAEHGDHGDSTGDHAGDENRCDSHQQ